jgi:thiamine biosynthesis lipoprotein ApbE
MGHLIDPRTGLPALDWGSISVSASLALDADCLSTALFVLGPEAALAFAATHPGIEVVCLVRSGNQVRVAASPGLAASLEILDPSRCVLDGVVGPNQRSEGGGSETSHSR